MTEKQMTNAAMACMEAGHWQMKDQEPYVCFDCVKEIVQEELRAANLQVSAMKEVVRAARGLKAHGSALNGTHANILWKALDALGAE